MVEDFKREVEYYGVKYVDLVLYVLGGRFARVRMFRLIKKLHCLDL